MIVHLLKNPTDPLAVQMITTQSSSHFPSPVVILLSPTDINPEIPQATIYRVTDGTPDQRQGEIDYARLVDLIFAADKVIAW